MTFSMAATDWYPTMHQSWGNWPPLHVQGSYMAPRWQGGKGSSGFYGAQGGPMPTYRSDKPPLTQLQELTSVFPPVDDCFNRHLPASAPTYIAEPHFPVKDRFTDHDCDSVYTPDPSRTEKLCEREADAGYASDRLSLDEGPYSVEAPGPRECDSGFGPTFHAKEEPESFEMCGDCDSGCARDAHHDVSMGAGFLPKPPTPDLATSAREAFADSDSGCADITTKWEESPAPSVLPGFQQAFGSTEIGRFSRNDFFTNPSPPQSIEPACEPLRKAVRKPRSPRVKQVRKDRCESPKLRTESRKEVPNVPLPETQCHGRPCGGPYECGSRYCSEYSRMPPVLPPPSGYQYGRSPAHHPYSPYESPYLRPFPFPLSCGQSWSESRWHPTPASYHPSPPPPPTFQQSYQPQQSWSSANVYPFMRIDY